MVMMVINGDGDKGKCG